MTETEWLGELKAGDEVVAQPGDYIRSSTIERVAKVTATQIVLANHGNERYRRDSGWMVGHSTGYRRARILPVTEELRETIRRDWLVSHVKGFQWDRVPLEALERVWAILAAVEGGAS